MRLIDADALTRTMYLKSFETDDGRQRWDSGLWIRYKIFEEARDEQPIVDAVPLIRCKDCKYQLTNFDEEEQCPIYTESYKMDDMFFCPYGERSEE